MRHVHDLSDVSFRLMKEYPTPTYFDVLQTYYRRQFYKFSGNRPGGFSGFIADKAAPEDFIQALVIQQNSNSAMLLDTMLNRLPLQTCMPENEYILNEVIIAIWEHPCPAYAKLREKIKLKAEEILKLQNSINLDTSAVEIDTTGIPIDTTGRIIRW
jgi:hypothetical protein